MDFILSWVRSGLLFGVFASVILMLCPNKSYQKHIGMIIGLIFILVMLNPLMKFKDIDSRTYLDYVKNYLLMENNGDVLSDDNQRMYEESVETQLKAVMIDRGYPLETVEIDSDSKGVIYRVTLRFEGNVTNTDGIESYLRSLFGEGVSICYED